MSTKRKDTKGRILRDGEIQKADGRYEFRYYDVKGERRSIYSWRLTATDPIPEGKRECLSLREMERDILRDVQDGLLTQQKVALNARWDDYITNKPELKQSTRTNYRYMYDKYVREEIGHLEVTSINYSTMKKFFNHLLHDCGFKPNSVEIVHTILHPVFTIAMRDGLIRMNPTDGIMADLKRSNDWEKPKRHALTEEQQRAFMAYVETSDKYRHWNPLFACLLGTGCRIGEMLGLRWEDVLWKENIISINHNCVEIKCLKFLIDRVWRAYVLYLTVDLKAVVVNDHYKVVQFSGTCEHSSFPYLTFLDLAVSKQCIYTVVFVIKLSGKCHTDCCGNALSKRT